MNNLSDLFRDVSNMVVEQGTILDRIDFHIADARGNINKGNVDLQKIVDAENNPRVRTAQICLVNWIIVFTFIFVLKHAA